ncbi:MAG: diguanylate cyclase, partial [Candidatus Eisenbacteria bacterium]|nr:diguanylate cyclase [Candidatus Eisenbacteria bacterium]
MLQDHSTTTAPGSRHQIVRVLLIDDEEDAYVLTRNLLRRADTVDCELEWTPQASIGLERLRAGEVDVCLLDLQIPDGDGIQLLREARQSGVDTPIILLTALGDTRKDITAMDLGADGFLDKCKTDAQTLERTIRYALDSRRRLAEAVKTAERQSAIALGAGEGVWTWDLESDRLVLSDAWKAWLGETDLSGLAAAIWLDSIHAEDRDRFQNTLQAHLSGKSERFECEYRIGGEGRNERWVQVRGKLLKGDDGRRTRITGWQIDITDRKHRELLLEREALTDPLTGLHNRVHFLRLLESALTRSRRRAGYRFAVLFFDLDRFKSINDSLGHLAGDQLLCKVARRLAGCLRANDAAARHGGDEFTVLLDDMAHEHDAIRVTERIQRELSNPFQIDGEHVPITVSVGIALSGRSVETPEQLLRDADRALYQAKQSGRACYEISDREQHSHAVRTLQIEHELRRAVENGAFRLHYQPVVALATGRPVGVEALLRWPREDQLLSPVHFWRIAEETRLCLPIGRWTMETACRWFKQWSDDGSIPSDFFLSINVSPEQMRERRLAQDLERILAEAGLSPERIQLEIPEVVLTVDPEATSSLQSFRARGISITLDDYGRGP